MLISEKTFIHSTTGVIMTQEEIDNSVDSEEDDEYLLSASKVANHGLESMALPRYDVRLMTEWNTFYERQKILPMPGMLALQLTQFVTWFCDLPIAHNVNKMSDFLLTFAMYKAISQEECSMILAKINKLLPK